MKTAKLFKNGESQAVRLPKEFRFPGNEVFIKRIGSAVVLLPKARSWETLIESLAKFPPDFMETRGQPADIDRRFPRRGTYACHSVKRPLGRSTRRRSRSRLLPAQPTR